MHLSIGTGVRIAFALVGISLLSASSARADAAGAAACAGKLDKPSRLIYDATAQTAVSSGDLRDLVASKTRSLVMSGQLPRAGAREAAEAAGRCLVLLRQ
ncbi:hypothetical protein ACFQU1_21925 [Chelatococcus sp. GCM10030263]|uniref:hypothetical protein n=1 Tax=Chelatococcus sp. GCM10030263 TaxID=3273387 RepID=UPI00360D0DA2